MGTESGPTWSWGTPGGVLAVAPLDGLSVSPARTWSAACSLVVIVHAQASLDHHVAVEVFVSTVLICNKKQIQISYWKRVINTWRLAQRLSQGMIWMSGIQGGKHYSCAPHARRSPAGDFPVTKIWPLFSQSSESLIFQITVLGRLTDLFEVCKAPGYSPPSPLASAALHSPRWTACRRTGSAPPAHGNLLHMF